MMMSRSQNKDCCPWSANTLTCPLLVSFFSRMLVVRVSPRTCTSSFLFNLHLNNSGATYIFGK